jgi:hypothetical protein
VYARVIGRVLHEFTVRTGQLVIRLPAKPQPLHFTLLQIKELNAKMKLIVTGATGFVGSEVIRQALRNSAITKVVALARKPVLPPSDAGPDADTTKLQSVLLEDWVSPYSEAVKDHLKGADGCIWFVPPTLVTTVSRSHVFVIGLWLSHRPNQER